MVKLIIAGGRNFNDAERLNLEVALFIKINCANAESITIISGHCKTGADKLGEDFAKAKGYKLQLFPADWDKHGKAAGPIRNEAMACEGTHYMIFWDRQSRGTRDMIKRAQAHNLTGKIVYY